MAPLSLKIILDEGAVTRTLLFDTTTTVRQAHRIVKEKIHNLDPEKEYGFFLTSADSECSGVWLEADRNFEYYMLREGDQLYYLEKIRNLRVRMLDGSVKTMHVDVSKNMAELMVSICEKIGITNHEEYGLCRENLEEEQKPMTGTLTLKKKSTLREKDAKLEQLQKKLKTDDNVEWLDQHKTLRELQVDPNETLLFKRRLFYSDRNIDSRDPVQLNLLYVQTRDAILDGRQVVTEDKAIEFAGIQCQIQYEDFNEDKHKPGFIENLKEFLPEQYATSWGIEKKIFKEHKKHHGLSPLEAKNLYTKTARELPTYGVTFFLVKEKQKSKKKLVPRLLGINSESILRLDEETKEILQVWPLTQVKSYRAGSESFTLDFGDYSEKEYAVKTNDAMRIRDILQGYIDIIKKRLAAPYNVAFTQGEAMTEEIVEMSRGNIIQNIVANKITEHSFVGPSRIVSVEYGQNIGEGTRIVTVQQTVTTSMGDNSQKAHKGEMPSQNSIAFEKRLNHINSLSVKAVTFLSDPNKINIEGLLKIVGDMQSEIPAIVEGVKEIENIDPIRGKKLQNQLDELCNHISKLSHIVTSSRCDTDDTAAAAKDEAMRIADLSALMCLGQDATSRRRSQLIKSSRDSFIADERTEAHLRRLSFKTAAQLAHEAIDNGYSELDEEYTGPVPSPEIIETLEKALIDQIGKLNAATALLSIAHSDPNNVDYSSAVTCMTTIKELLPEMISDFKTLCSADNGDKRLALDDDIRRLLDRIAALCRLTGTDDAQKMLDAEKEFGEVSRKLIYTFNRGNKQKETLDKENEIIDLAKDVGENVSHLLSDVNDLLGLVSEDPRCLDLEKAGTQSSDAAMQLIACAELVAASIQEPHCQSALTASCENLSSTLQRLEQTSKPFGTTPGSDEEAIKSRLHDRSLDLAKALQKLMDAYSNLPDNKNSEDNDSDVKGAQKIKYIASLSHAKKALLDAEQLLNEDSQKNIPSTELDVQKLRSALSQKLAQLNAAIASLRHAAAGNEDYVTSDAVISTLSQLTPEIIREAKILEGHIDDEGTQVDLLESLKKLIEATKNICEKAESGDLQGLDEATEKYAASSGRLHFVFNPNANTKTKNKIVDIANDIGDKTSVLIAEAHELYKQDLNSPLSNDLLDASDKCQEAARELISCSKIVAPTIHEPRCQDTLTSACEHMASAVQDLALAYKPLVDEPNGQAFGKRLMDKSMDLIRALDRLKAAYPADHYVSNGNDSDANGSPKVKFIASLSHAKKALSDAEQVLNENSHQQIISQPDLPKLRGSLADKLAQLNAAIASLRHATAGQHDYLASEAAINTLTQLTPEIIRDAKLLEGHLNDGSQNDLLNDLKDLLEATKNICKTADDKDTKGLNEATMDFAKSSGKLYFVFNPKAKPATKDKVIDTANNIRDKTTDVLSDIRELNKQIANSPHSKDLLDASERCEEAVRDFVDCAKITAPTIHEAKCRESLRRACEHLASTLQDLANASRPLAEHPDGQAVGRRLANQIKDLNKALDRMKATYTIEGNQGDTTNINNIQPVESKEKLQFKANLSSLEKVLTNADQEIQNIDLGVSGMNPNADTRDLRLSLTAKLAALNAAISSLLHQTIGETDYKSADNAVVATSKIIPDFIKDVKLLQPHLDDKNQDKLAENLKAMLEATKDCFKSLEEGQSKDRIKEAASALAPLSGQLNHIINPNANVRKENQILDLSRSVCENASKLLVKVYDLEKEVGDEESSRLDEAGTKIVDAAQVFLTAAQITGPTMDEPVSQDAMISFIETFKSLLHELDDIWMPLVNKRPELEKKLREDSNRVLSSLDDLKAACLHSQQTKANPDKDLLVSSITEAKNKINEAQALCSKDRLRELPPPEVETMFEMTTQGCVERKNVQPTKMKLFDKLSALNESIALVVQKASDRDASNNEQRAYVDNISQLTADIVRDALSMHEFIPESTLDVALEESKSLCESTQAVCSSLEDNNIEKLNEAASKYASSSGKLFYVFSHSNNVDKENQILNVARSACERTSLMLSRVSRLAQGLKPEEAQQLDTAGVKLADAAQVLLTNAQITAPSIQDPRCQSALNSSIDKVSSLAVSLGATWKPLVHEPNLQLGEQMDKDLQQLQFELDKLRQTCQCVDTHEPNVEVFKPDNGNVTVGTNDANKATEKIIVEDTPLRALAAKILDSISSKIENSDIQDSERNAKRDFAKKLDNSIVALDYANARCREDPLDEKKRQDLENAIQNLQHICLLSRRDSQESNIVDLMDYIKDVTSAAEELSTETNAVNPNCGKKTLMDIRQECDHIKYNAELLSSPQEVQAEDSIIGDMLMIEKFAEECDDSVQTLKQIIDFISDELSRTSLEEKHQFLSECCDLLRFATKSSISSASSMAYEENLQNLVETEEKINQLLKIAEESTDLAYDKDMLEVNAVAAKDAQTALYSSIVAKKHNSIPQLLTQYAVKLQAATPREPARQLKLKEHLDKLNDLLKKLTTHRLREIATWQSKDSEDTLNINKEIQKELEGFSVVSEADQGPQITDKANLYELMLSQEKIITGDEKQIQAKFDEHTEKLSTLAGVVLECTQRPELMAKTLHRVALTAGELSGIAKSLNTKDVILERKIDEATKEMQSSTYNLIKTSESVKGPESRYKLLDACRSLIESVNKLARVTSQLKGQSSELQRSLKLQQSALAADRPTCALGYGDCWDALLTQQDIIHKLNNDDVMSREDCATTLRYVTAAACSSADYATHSAYLLSITEDDKDVATRGMFDNLRFYKITDAVTELCSQIISTGDIEQVKNIEVPLQKQIQQLAMVIEDSAQKIDQDDNNKIKEDFNRVNTAHEELKQAIYQQKEEQVLTRSMKLLDAINRLKLTISRLPTPRLDDSPAVRNDAKEVLDLARNLLTNTSQLVKKVSSSDDETMTWVMYGRDGVTKAYEALLQCIRDKGTKSRLLQSSASPKEDNDAPPKSTLQTKIELTNKWLQNPGCKNDIKKAAIQAAEYIIDMGEKMCQDLKNGEKEDMLHVVCEAKELLQSCCVTYNSKKASLLLERLRDLKKMLERNVVTRVVEDFLEEEPLEDLQAIHKEKDVKKREFLLDKKIAELISHLDRMKRTVAFVSDTSTSVVKQELVATSNQVELLAPSLVKAVQESVRKPEDDDAIENYRKLVMEYADSLARVRELCDRSVDPMDFAQAAGETMARIKENSQNDPQRSVYTSRVITRLGNRVVEAGMSSPNVQRDPELQKTLEDIKKSIAEATSARHDTAAEIIRKTTQVESVLGGETIFQKEAESKSEPIFAAAYGLHEAVRDWSARDNEVVACAKRVAVLMAQLSHHMLHDRKKELIATSKEIVAKSQEVAQLARKHARACADARIQSNLLQVCDRIPTISGQLKMLTTVKSSFLGHQGTEEDIEAMNMLVGNAQNLMLSIREVVNVSESASVKIMSQNGRRMKWVRRKLY